MRNTIVLTLIVLLLSIAYVATLKAQVTIVQYDNGTTTGAITRTAIKAQDQGFGSGITEVRNQGGSTASETITKNPTTPWLAFRVQESTIVDATAQNATDVLFLYWATATGRLTLKLTDSVGTLKSTTIQFYP